jgi:hypothetical protein
MARQPTAKARITGAAAKNPQRHRNRNNPAASPLGDPSPFLDQDQKEAWHKFLAEIPWLVAADRAMLEVASILRARFQAEGGYLGVNHIQVYSAILSKLGATPADRSRITPADDEPAEDEFFGPN